MTYKSDVLSAGIGYLPFSIQRQQADGFGLSIGFKDIDMTAQAFVAQLRTVPDASGDPLAIFSISAPVLIGADTKITISLTQAQVLALPPAGETGQPIIVYWDLWADGKARLAGEVKIIGGVSQS